MRCRHSDLLLQHNFRPLQAFLYICVVGDQPHFYLLAHCEDVFLQLHGKVSFLLRTKAQEPHLNVFSGVIDDRFRRWDHWGSAFNYKVPESSVGRYLQLPVDLNILFGVHRDELSPQLILVQCDFAVPSCVREEAGC